MKLFRPLSIRHTIWLSIALTVTSIVLGASALYSYQLYRNVQYAQRFRVQAIAETYAAQLAPLLATGQRAELAAFVEELPRHPDICLLAILNTSNKPIAVKGDAGLLQRYLDGANKNSEGVHCGNWNIPGDPEHSLPELNLAVVGIFVSGLTEQLGTLVCIARQSKELNVSPEQVWNYFAKLAIIAAICMGVGIFWLRQQVLKPLAMLARRSKSKSRSPSGPALFVDRHDEIGDLARGLVDMRLDLDEWRQRVNRLERNVTSRVAAENQKITRELRIAQKKIWTDPLTKLGNRRLFDDKFDEIFRAQSEEKQDLSIIILDLDNFKTLNDTLGHDAGDKLLVFVGELLKQGLRAQDLAIRLGGDEFLVILPSVSIESAQAIAERTIRMFAQQAGLFRVEPKPTMSAGIVSLIEHQPGDAESMLQLVDQALYEAKKTGKSRVYVHKGTAQVAVSR